VVREEEGLPRQLLGDTLELVEDPAWEAAMDECTARAEDRFQERIDDVEVVLYTPHPDDYASGGTTAYCTFYGYDGQVGGGAAFEQTSAAGGVS